MTPFFMQLFKTICAIAILMGGCVEWAGAVPADRFRGLWVGQVTLNYVNEVTVALDEENVKVAPDPKVPTRTSDQAHLRLMIHVNGAGQVSLLKDVAVLSRVPNVPVKSASEVVDLLETPSVLANGTARLEQERDIALVTDERLYSEFPPQPAIRIGTVAFDFGDGKATKAVTEVMESAVWAASGAVDGMHSGRFGDRPARLQAIEEARAEAVEDAVPVVENAEVAAAFDRFLKEDFPPSKVTAFAEPGGLEEEAAEVLEKARALRDQSFYRDSRGVDMVNRIVEAVQNAVGEDERGRVAHNIAATFEDVRNEYHRFLAGKLFGDMIGAGSETAASAAVKEGATEATIRTAVQENKIVIEARGEAAKLDAGPYNDTRATLATETILNAIVDGAVAALSEPPVTREAAREGAEEAAQAALAGAVKRFEVPHEKPTLDYNTFVRSEEFHGSVETAAEAAAEAAVFERANNSLHTFQSIRDAARVSTAEALRDVFAEAARAIRTSLPMTGAFGPGLGDPRLRISIDDEQASLGEPAATARLLLPANHPTNPFRHRRHPSHQVGFDVTRNIRLDFDGEPQGDLDRAGFGVDRVTGTYREEIFGLHKPLGPDQNIGLRVEGRFELNRISLIDTLNAR